MSASPQMIPLSRFAVALGITKNAVKRGAFRDTPAHGKILVKGQLSDGWCLHQLPIRYAQSLERIATKRGYRNAEHLLSDPPRRFVPRDAKGDPVPLNQVAPQCIERAFRFRSALELTLALRDQLGERETQQRALAAFRRVVNVSEKTWDRWLKRVIQRDAGEERFDDLALYLDEVVMRRPEARQHIAVAETAADRTVLDTLSRVKNPARPTLDEAALIWTVACEFIAQQVERGGNPKRVQRRLFDLLSTAPVPLARTDEALRKAIKRKLSRWMAGGQTLAALEDQRPALSGKREAEMNGEDRNKLVGHARINCGGRLSQAYRELRSRGQLSSALTSRHLDNPASKSYVPRHIREAVAPDVKRLASIHLGPREHKLRGPYHTRDWSGVAAGDWFQSDDLTPPVYFYQRSESGVELMRGQFLPMIDERTTMILGFVLIPERNYNSLAIRSLFTEICCEHGLPRRGLSFERGIWKSSKILTGGATNFGLGDDACTGLRRLGMQFRHADLPRGKVIERTLGLLQDSMESLPGYCGRNEMLERHERFQRAKLDVEAGRVPASQHFLSAEQIRERFAEIVERYNDAPQQGRKLNGISPREGWEQLQNENEPRARFHAATHYFLASDVRKLRIGRNGITFRIGKRTFNYKGEETGKRQGEVIFAWFNPQQPDLLPCTMDRAGNGVFVMERSYELPAVGASRELLSSENAKAAAHRRHAAALYYTVKNALPLAAFRGQTLDRTGLKLGQEIEAQQQKTSARKREEGRLEIEITRRSKRARISPLLVPRTRESLDALDEYEAVNAEMDRKLKEESLAPTPGHEPAFNHDEPGQSAQSGGKVYILDAPAKPLTAVQRNGMYWRLWKAAQRAQPGVNRFAITSRVLGCVKKITEMTDEEFLKLCHVFESIARK